MKTLTKILLLSFILLAIQSCYKLKDRKKIIGSVTTTNINTGEGIAGIKYKINEIKNIKYESDDVSVFLEGETDQNGKVNFEFKRPHNLKWSYFLIIDKASFPSNLNYLQQNNVLGTNVQLKNKGTEEYPINNDVILEFE